MKVLWALCLLGVMGYVFHTLALEGDTSALLRETRASLDCMSAGQWSGCTAGGQFPLLQKIPSFLLMLFGASDGVIIRFLAGLSLASFVGILWTSWRYLRKRSCVSALLYWITLCVGPFFWYARSSFSEMLSAFFALSLFLICLKGSSRKKHFFWLLIASLAKEVAFPFMFVLGVLGIYLSKSEKKNSKKLRWQDFLGLGAGALSAMLLNFAHNYFRYGSIINASYVQSIHFVPDLRTQASFFVGLFFSGNGGWIPFWPLAALCFLSALIWGRGRVKVAALTCTVLLGGLVFGFSRWAYPFGWVCWGPRFFMPWIPVFLFAIFSAEPEFFEKQLLKIKDWGRAVLAALVLLVSYPHALAVFSFTFVYSLFWPDTTCPKPVIIEQDQVYYFQCIEHYIWSKGSLLFQAFRFAWYEPGLDNYAIFPALLLVIVWLGLFLRLFQELDRARNHALS